MPLPGSEEKQIEPNQNKKYRNFFTDIKNTKKNSLA